MNRKTNLAEASNSEEARRIAAEREAEHPYPRFVLPAHANDGALDAVIDFAWRIVKWNVEEILDGRTTKHRDLEKRQSQARVLNDLHRTLEKFTRLKKSRAAEKQDERTDAELDAELIEGLRKVFDGRGT